MWLVQNEYNRTNYFEADSDFEVNCLSPITLSEFMFFFTKWYLYNYNIDYNNFDFSFINKDSALAYDTADKLYLNFNYYVSNIYKNKYKEDILEKLKLNNWVVNFKNIFWMVCDLHWEYIDNTYFEYFWNIDTTEHIYWLWFNTSWETNNNESNGYFQEVELPAKFFYSFSNFVFNENIIKWFKNKLLDNIEYIYEKCKYTKEDTNKRKELLTRIQALDSDFRPLEYFFIDKYNCKYNLEQCQTTDEIVEVMYNIIIANFLENEDNEYLIETYIKSLLEYSYSETQNIIVVGNYYYRKIGHIIMWLWLLFSNFIRNNEIVWFVKGWNLISFFEDVIFAFTWQNINISKKFYAEINNQNKLLFARLMLDKLIFNYISDENIFNEKITYYLLKKNILPEKFKNLWRASIERLKWQELLDIIIEYDIFYQHFQEDTWEEMWNMQQWNYINALSPIDYIYYIKLLEHKAKQQESETFEKYNISTLLESFLEKSELIKEYYNHEYDNIVNKFLANNTYFDLGYSIVIESDYLSELVSIWVAPQKSCQSILYNTGYNYKLIWHVLNPLTKLFIEIQKPENLKEIDFYNRLFILEDWTIEEMNKYIRARTIWAIKKDWFELQRFYWNSSENFRYFCKTTIINKYSNIWKEFKDYSKIFDNILGSKNYYSE